MLIHMTMHMSDTHVYTLRPFRYVNTLNMASQQIPKAYVESSIGLVSTATTAGPIAAALVPPLTVCLLPLD